MPSISTNNDIKSKIGIFRKLGKLSENATAPTVSADPSPKTAKEIKNPMKEDNVNFMFFCFSRLN